MVAVLVVGVWLVSNNTTEALVAKACKRAQEATDYDVRASVEFKTALVEMTGEVSDKKHHVSFTRYTGDSGTRDLTEHIYDGQGKEYHRRKWSDDEWEVSVGRTSYPPPFTSWQFFYGCPERILGVKRVSPPKAVRGIDVRQYVIDTGDPDITWTIWTAGERQFMQVRVDIVERPLSGDPYTIRYFANHEYGQSNHIEVPQ